MNKVSLTRNSVVILVSAMFFSSCISTFKTEPSLGQQVAKISYSAYRSGTLFLADKSKCTSLLGLGFNKREVTPIVRSHHKLDLDSAVTIPASDNHIFLASTDTLLDDNTLKLWFKFPVKASKYYKVYIQKTKVDKKLFNLDGYKYNNYLYSVGVVDELGQTVMVEHISSPTLDTECKSKMDS